MRNFVSSSFLVCVVVCVSACTSRDVTGNSKYHVGYIPDSIYVLKTERELVHAEWDEANVHGMVAPGAVQDNATEWLDLMGTLPAGTRIRIDQLRYNTNITLSDVDRIVVAYGYILDPPYAGTRVSMGGVSDYEPFPSAPLRSMVMKPKQSLLEAAGE